MGLKFKDPDVEAGFETDREKDGVVHFPGGKIKGAGWKGLLSEVPLVQVERWIDRPGQNLFRRKNVQPAPEKKIKEKKQEE